MAESQAKMVLDLLHSLRTIHGTFADQAVAEDDMERILAAAVRAANSSARQCYSIIRLGGVERVQEVCAYAAPQALVFLADFTRINDEARRRGFAAYQPGLFELLTTTIDASLATQTAIVAAKALGLDSMVTNSPLRLGEPEQLAALLDLPPEACLPLFAVLFGYPQTEPDHKQKRYLGPGLLHHGRYQRLTEDQLRAMSAEYDQPGMGLGSTPWREQGYESYFDWFFRAWRPTPDNSKAKPPADLALAWARRAGFVR